MTIEELAKDEAFVAKMKAAKDFAEAAALLNAQGIEVTAEELEAIAAAQNGELDEDALENVAGGRIIWRPFPFPFPLPLPLPIPRPRPRFPKRPW